MYQITTGWVILSLAKPLELDTVAWFYSSRFLSGLGANMFFLTGPIYVMEMCRPEIRGAVGNTIALFSITGTFVVNLFGAFMDWTALSVIALIPPCKALN